MKSNSLSVSLCSTDGRYWESVIHSQQEMVTTRPVFWSSTHSSSNIRLWLKGKFTVLLFSKTIIWFLKSWCVLPSKPKKATISIWNHRRLHALLFWFVMRLSRTWLHIHNHNSRLTVYVRNLALERVMNGDRPYGSYSRMSTSLALRLWVSYNAFNW